MAKKKVMRVDESGGVHAMWAPSAAHRWLNCPASVVESEGMEQGTSSPAALEGTRVHKLGEDVLNGETQLEDLLEDQAYDAVELYVNEAEERFDNFDSDTTEYGVEDTLDLMMLIPEGSPNHWTMFGSADFWAYDPEGFSTPVIIDYKNGRSLVETADNPQLKLYAYGLMMKVDKPIMGVRVGIVQPNAAHIDGPVRYVDIPMREIKEIGLAARYALTNTHIKKAGDWCHFCPLVGNCRVKLALSQNVATSEFSKEVFAPTAVGDLTDKQITFILQNASGVVKFLDSVKAHAMVKMKTKPIKGLKLVRNPGRGMWKSDQEFANMVGALEIKDAFNLKPKGIGEIKKQLKELYEDSPEDLIAQYVTKSVGGFSVAAESDGRAEIVSAAAEFDDN